MDEMMIRTSDLQGQTNFYYKGRRVIVPESMRKNCPEQVLVAMRICWFGKSRLYVVPAKTKLSAAVLIESILKPILTYDIPWLYGDQKHKVIFDMDSAPSHRAVITQEYFKQQKLKYIPAE